jgi:type I restriction enzyme, S subunit
VKWARHLIGDIARLSYGKLPPAYVDPSNGFPIFTGYRIAGYSAEYLYEEPRVVIVARGVGGTGDVKLSPPKSWITNLSIVLSIDKTWVDQRFLYYRLRGEPLREKLNTGAAQAQITIESLSRYEITIPSLAVQLRIANTISTFDELIENNCRRMAFLEEAAREIYGEWFVRLRFPGREHTDLVDGVPEKWARRELAHCATFLSGGTPSKARDDFWDGDMPWVSSGELTEFRIYATPLRITDEAAEAGSRLVPRDTILAVVRGMSLAKEWRISLTSREMAFNQDLKAIVANADVDPLYLFHALDAQRDDVRDRTGEASHGTKKLETAVLSALPILVPPQPLQTLFREHVEPMHALWDNLHRQNEKLRAARDLLLPRLMSGELVV